MLNYQKPIKMKEITVIHLLTTLAKANISENDLGYITRWVLSKELDLRQTIEKINKEIGFDFFDNSIRIKRIIQKYEDLLQAEIESQLNALENQPAE